MTITEESAYSAAKAVDEKFARGEAFSPLAGVPFVLKDSIPTKGIRTTCASKMLENHVPVYNAAVWESLCDHNAVLAGKGNMDEFGMGATGETSYFGGTRNPHNDDYTAGGSSGGVAAAVAAGLSVYGIGSDTGGSVRQTAALCGLVGLTPTYGSVSRRGLIAYASSLDQIGPITSSVRDAALVFDAICGHDPMDMTNCGGKRVGRLCGDVKGLRIGIAPQFYNDIPRGVADSLSAALDVYKKLGASLVDVDFPILPHALPAYYILACAETSSNLGRFDGLRYGQRATDFEDLDDFVCKTRTEGFGAEVRRRIMPGTCVLSAGYHDKYYKKALLLKNVIANAFDEIFEKCDCLITPTLPVTAIQRGQGRPAETYRSDLMTVPVNITDLPAVSIPCGVAGGFPVGMQIIGGHFREDLILGAALAFETETSAMYVMLSDCGVVL